MEQELIPHIPLQTQIGNQLLIHFLNSQLNIFLQGNSLRNCETARKCKYAFYFDYHTGTACSIYSTKSYPLKWTWLPADVEWIPHCISFQWRATAAREVRDTPEQLTRTYGTGYCDVQPAKPGRPSCDELDIWEANSLTNVYTTHPCLNGHDDGVWEPLTSTEFGQ